MGEIIVSMKNICKSFPGVKALDKVDFELRSGEVMALLGENGAGKSTLMKVLSGVYTRDEGSLEIFGRQYGDLTPKQAQEAGVAIIHQELNMCKHLTVTENMFLGREKRGKVALDNSAMEREAKEILDDLKIDISPNQIVGELPVSKQQMVEIAKALSIHAKILIMDEPTSSLTAREIEDLFRIIKKLKSEGKGIVYISHRLEELQHIVDRVTIMRDGQYITSMDFGAVTMEQIISYMVGREIKEKFPRVECKKGKKVFEVKNLNAGKMVRNINFSVYEGEIVGFAGLMGAGRTELKVETGNLRIQFGRTQDRLLIRISDDGVGMDEETLTKLNRKLGRDGDELIRGEERRGGIALANVNSRIHLLFGEEYGLHVYSVPQKGTDVEITIPFQRDEDI